MKMIDNFYSFGADLEYVKLQASIFLVWIEMRFVRDYHQLIATLRLAIQEAFAFRKLINLNACLMTMLLKTGTVIKLSSMLKLISKNLLVCCVMYYKYLYCYQFNKYITA